MWLRSVRVSGLQLVGVVDATRAEKAGRKADLLVLNLQSITLSGLGWWARQNSRVCNDITLENSFNSRNNNSNSDSSSNNDKNSSGNCSNDNTIDIRYLV